MSTLARGATTDFVADGNITIDDVTYGSLTADLLIMSGSKAETWSMNSGNFSVSNPDPSALFSVGSSDVSANSIRVKSGTDEVSCANNTTPGTSYVSLPVSAGTYAVYPSADLCSAAATSSGGGGGGGGGRKKTPPLASGKVSLARFNLARGQFTKGRFTKGSPWSMECLLTKGSSWSGSP